MVLLKLYNCRVPCLLEHLKSYLHSESRLHILEFSGYYCNMEKKRSCQITASLCLLINFSFEKG